MKPVLDLRSVRHADHLILVSAPAGHNDAPDPSFFQRNWSMAWANFLLQEVGPYTLSPIESFDFKNLNSYRFVYLPSCLVGKWENWHRDIFKSYVEAGGTLVLEGPVANLIESSGIQFSSKKRLLKSITGLPNGIWPQPMTEFLRSMVFETWGWEIESETSDVEVILEMEKLPVLFTRQLGQGSVVTLGFDLGLLLVGLQQGIPVKGAYRLRKLFGTQSRVIEPEDLVLKASFLNSTSPHADLFERFLFKVITANHPAPRWWYFPSPYKGAVISTHDDEAIGADRRLEAMCETEKLAGIRGTLFVVSDRKLRGRSAGCQKRLE